MYRWWEERGELATGSLTYWTKETVAAVTSRPCPVRVPRRWLSGQKRRLGTGRCRVRSCPQTIDRRVFNLNQIGSLAPYLKEHVKLLVMDNCHRAGDDGRQWPPDRTRSARRAIGPTL
ncbi:hypothetical protein EVAR_40677_1 [Eumeta japonica]|uniref:Uncharacterized protein n=1 Tax=Eumeta variegata TaxID=151549 RepID=A0A4C1X8S3_EUMVA|nr:hypothetical protein EVAR_40677_1 [Eumeta japonica]